MDEASPATTYGLTKLSFEAKVLSLKQGYVLRLSNMIGPDYKYMNVGCKFMQWLYESFTTKAFVGLRYDEIRSFVYVNDVTRLIEKIILLSLSKSSMALGGVYNVGGPRGLSRLDLARVLSRCRGTDIIVVDRENTSIHSDDEAWRVYGVLNSEGVLASGIKNPRDVTMSIIKTEQVFEFSFTNIDEAINECVSTF